MACLDVLNRMVLFIVARHVSCYRKTRQCMITSNILLAGTCLAWLLLQLCKLNKHGSHVAKTLRVCWPPGGPQDYKRDQMIKCAGMQVTAHPAVAHALKVRKALVFARYTAFFQLYAAAPNLGRALMDTCFAKVRFAALETIVEGCRAAKVKVHNLASMLGFLVEPQRLAQLETAAHEQSSEVDLDGSNSMVLPGCRQTSYSGQYGSRGDCPPLLPKGVSVFNAYVATFVQTVLWNSKAVLKTAFCMDHKIMSECWVYLAVLPATFLD